MNSAQTWLLLNKIFIISRSKWSGLEIREYGRGDPLRWPRDTLYPQKLVLTWVSRVRSRTKATEFVCSYGQYLYYAGPDYYLKL
jgi:hypothetical protein